VLISNHLPKLGTNLVTALTGLNVNNLSHILMWLQINLSIICAALSTKSWSLLYFYFARKKNGRILKRHEIVRTLVFIVRTSSVVFELVRFNHRIQHQ